MLSDALEVCDKFPNCKQIQSQKASILVKLNEFEEAIKVCDKFPDYEYTVSKKISILVKLNRVDEALNLCNKFLYFKVVREQKEKILESLKNNSIFVDDTDTILKLSLNFLNSIYSNDITENDILYCDLNDEIKFILLFAFYKQQNYPKRYLLNFIASTITINNLNLPQNIYNSLLEQAKSNSKVFNVFYYYELIQLFYLFSKERYCVRQRTK